MTASTTPRFDAALWQRLEGLASARRMTPNDLLGELIAEAETTQLVAEVNAELERLARSPQKGRRSSSQMRRLDAAVRDWMAE
jgi:predicted DNA-binding ribbon-helix-helix protein